MKRAQALLAVQYAGYHGDKAESTRLLIENRIGRAAHLEAWKKGAAMKAAGIACQCGECVTPDRLVCKECGAFICKADCPRRTQAPVASEAGRVCGPGCGTVVGRQRTPMYCSEACCDAGRPLNPMARVAGEDKEAV